MKSETSPSAVAERISTRSELYEVIGVLDRLGQFSLEAVLQLAELSCTSADEQRSKVWPDSVSEAGVDAGVEQLTDIILGRLHLVN